MDFYQEMTSTADYGRRVTERSSTDIESALQYLSTNDEYALYVDANTGERTSKVICMTHRSWVCNHPLNHIMCLDCDSEFDMLAAARILNISGIGYAIVKSNGKDSSYWIITDFIGPIDDVLARMRDIPGIDNKYLQFCTRQRMIFIRAYPKIIDYSLKFPIFPDTHTLTDYRVIKWYDEFKVHFESRKLKIATTTRLLHNAKANGMMAKVVADPSFEI